MIDWATLASFATVVQGIIVVIAAIYAYSQVREATRSRDLQATIELFELLGADDIKEIRRRLSTLSTKPEELSDEQWFEIEKVSNSYNRAGLLVAHGLLDEDILQDLFAETILLSWEKFSPYIQYERKRRFGRYQNYFEYLAKRSQNFLQQRYPGQEFGSRDFLS